MTRTGTLSIAVLGWTVAVLAALGPAYADGGGIVVTPTDPGVVLKPPKVGIDVTDPGAPGTVGQGGHRSGGRGGGPVCTVRPEPTWEEFFRGIPAGIGDGQDRIDPQARLFSRICDGVSQGFVWLGPSEAADVSPALPTPEELAERAAGELVLPLPVPRHSPDLRIDGQSAVIVGEHTWIWVDRPAWTPQRKRVQVGPVWAQVTATPVRLSFDPGTGEGAASCTGPGTPYTPQAGVHAASPDCDYVYSRSSHGLSGGTVTARYAIGWRVSWVGSTGAGSVGGVLPDMTSQAVTTFAVAEAQGLITG